MIEQPAPFYDEHGRGTNGSVGSNVLHDSHPTEASVSNGQRLFEPILDSAEAAALLHIHPKTLQRLARNGEIPGFRIGKLWGFRASVLNRWLERRMTG
jgi:excisionase family DNA binding protein